MPEQHEHNHSNGHLHKDAVFAARFNRGSMVVKLLAGIMSANPALVTEAGHDLGDDDTYRTEAKAILEEDPHKKATLFKKAAIKLGLYSIIGFGIETGMEQVVKIPQRPAVGIVVGSLSFAGNYFVHRKFATHNHSDAENSQDHAHSDLKVSGATVASSALSVAGVPFSLVAGATYHVYVTTRSAYRNYRRATRITESND